MAVWFLVTNRIIFIINNNVFLIYSENVALHDKVTPLLYYNTEIINYTSNSILKGQSLPALGKSCNFIRSTSRRQKGLATYHNLHSTELSNEQSGMNGALWGKWRWMKRNVAMWRRSRKRLKMSEANTQRRSVELKNGYILEVKNLGMAWRPGNESQNWT